MRERRILYLDDRRLSAYRWRAGQVSGEGSFAATADGRRAFADYLHRYPDSRFTLLVNGSEESFRTQTIPRLAGSERNSVIGRKLAQHFPGCPYTASLSLGHERLRRREERVLLAALLAPQRLEPWIEAMRAAGVALCGIHSLPLLGAALLGKVAGKELSCLLLTMQDDSLRESYFERGRLRFSRLAPCPAEGDDDLAPTLLAEAGRLRQYLINQQLIGDDVPLRMIVVADSASLPVLRAACEDSPAFSFDLRDSGDCARQVGLKKLPGGGRLDSVYVHLLATTPQAQFAAAQLRSRYLLRQVRAAIVGTAALTLAACLAFAGQRWFAAQALTHETGQAKATTRMLAERLAASGEDPETLAAPTKQLDGVIDRYQAIARSAASPEIFFREIGGALARVPAIDISSLEWQQPSGGSAGNAQHVSLQGSVVGDAGAATGDAAPSLLALIEHLRTQRGLTVTLGETSFAGSSADPGRDGMGKQTFSLRLERRPD